MAPPRPRAPRQRPGWAAGSRSSRIRGYRLRRSARLGEPGEDDRQKAPSLGWQVVEVAAPVGYFPEILGLDGHQLVADRAEPLGRLAAHVVPDPASQILAPDLQVVGGQ